MRQQVVRQQHRLCPLHVRVAGQVHVRRLAGPLRQHVLERHDLFGHADQGAPAPEAQCSGHLVVAAASRVDLGADVADQLGDAPLYGGMDVLVARREHEGVLLELLFDDVEQRR